MYVFVARSLLSFFLSLSFPLPPWTYLHLIKIQSSQYRLTFFRLQMKPDLNDIKTRPIILFMSPYLEASLFFRGIVTEFNCSSFTNIFINQHVTHLVFFSPFLWLWFSWFQIYTQTQSSDYVKKNIDISKRNWAYFGVLMMAFIFT